MGDEELTQKDSTNEDGESTTEANPSTKTPGAIDWVLHNYDPATTNGPNVDEELSRLQELKSFQLLDQDTDPSYVRFASMSSRIFDTEIALINLVDLGRIWQVAAHGISLHPDLHREMPRVTSLCAHTILQKELLLVVPDLQVDFRFRESPWAKSGIRFYAGTPLVSPEGAHIGTLCIMDSKPRPSRIFGEDMQEQIVDLAASIMDLMVEIRRIQSAKVPDYPGFIYSVEVQQSATYLRQQLGYLKDDSDLQTVMSDAHRHALHSAFHSADFLYSSLIPDRTLRRDSSSMERRRDESQPISPTLTPKPVYPRIGEVRALDVDSFIKSLESAMEAFPRQVNLWITVHPELPSELVFNDLKVFRSAIALLTSACERTSEGFVRLNIYPKAEENQSRVVVFECEDTGWDLDLDRFDRLFHPPSEDEDLDCVVEECIRIDEFPRQLEQRPVVCNHSSGPISGGFAVYPVAEYVGSIGGKYGFRPRFVQNSNGYSTSGSVFWFSIPLRDVSALPSFGMGGVLDRPLESVLFIDTRSSGIHRVESPATRPDF